MLRFQQASIMLAVADEFPEASKIHAQVLEARERVLGPDHTDTLKSVSMMSMVCHMEGRLSEAEVMGERAFQKQSEILGATHPDTLTTLQVSTSSRLVPKLV